MSCSRRRGLRRSEAYALRIGDINLRAGTVRVERALGLTTREIKSMKTGAARVVDLSPVLVTRLRNHIHDVREHAGAEGWGNPHFLRPTTTLAHYARWIPSEGNEYAALLDTREDGN